MHAVPACRSSVPARLAVLQLLEELFFFRQMRWSPHPGSKLPQEQQAQGAEQASNGA